MKKLLITLTIFCTAQSLFAQSDKLFVSDSSSPKLQQQLLFPNRIISKTNYGTIYALPQDNMPVFVTDSSFLQTMPVTGQTNQPGMLMPNPYYPKKNYGKGSTIKFDSLLLTAPLKIYQYNPKKLNKDSKQ